MNTKLWYEYRDGANWRFPGAVVVEGEMTPDLWARLRAACEEGEYFFARQVGLAERFAYVAGPHIADPSLQETGYPYDVDLDHCWHRIADDPGAWELTDDQPTDGRTVEEVVLAFEQARHAGWCVPEPPVSENSAA
jgi:hypothetical protein